MTGANDVARPGCPFKGKGRYMMIRFGRIVSSVRFWLVTTLSLVIAAALLTLGGIVGVQSASAAQTPIPLGMADSFGVLGSTTVTNTGNTIIDGDLGVNPGTAITGFDPPGVVNGTIYEPSAVASPPSTVNQNLLISATSDVVTAFNDAAGAGPSTTLAGQGGDNQLGVAGTLVPGVYNFPAAVSANLTGVLTLNGSGVYIFQASSTLVTAAGSSIVLENGADPGCVFWEVGSSATLGAASSIDGTILANASITAGTGADVTGRLLVETAAVTLDDNVITVPSDCVVSPPITVPTIPVTVPTIPVTVPTIPVTIPTIPVTIPTVPVTVPTVPVTIPTVPVTVPVTIPVTIPTVPVTTPPVVAPIITTTTTAPAVVPILAAPGGPTTGPAPAVVPVAAAPAAVSSGSSSPYVAPSATPSVTPTGAPDTGFGGASRSGPNPLLLALGGLALLAAAGAATQGLRRRRMVGALDDGLDGTE